MLWDDLSYNIVSQSKNISHCILVTSFALNLLPLTSNQIASWIYGYDYDYSIKTMMIMVMIDPMMMKMTMMTMTMMMTMAKLKKCFEKVEWDRLQLLF